MKNVKIEPGCISCGSCQFIAPEVFEVISTSQVKHPVDYKKLYALASTLSKKIVEKYGLKARDRAIICFENSPEFYIAYFALWQAGVVVAPVNTFLKQTELAHIITHAQPALIMTSSDRVEL